LDLLQSDVRRILLTLGIFNFFLKDLLPSKDSTNRANLG